MKQQLFKIELGCGTNKTDGYMGLDRFPLPNVDIVADLNEPYPIEDNTADVIYACHSLEHFDNLEFTINEIYRIGKHGAILQILAPYEYTTLNRANFYHKNVFNEDTFRFFTTTSYNYVLDEEEWYCPHATTWGLSESDNSTQSIELELINMEFFYYRQYMSLSEDEKRRARRSLNNVCDQVYYELIINKSGEPFTYDEIKEFQEKAKKIQPPLIQILRNRDKNVEKSISIYDDINKSINNKIDEMKKTYNNNNIKNEEYYKELISKNIEYEKKLKNQSKTIYDLQSKLEYVKQMNDKLMPIVLDVYKFQENKTNSRLKIFKTKDDLLSVLHNNNKKFIDNIILNCDDFKKNSILKLSKIIPYDNYFEYMISGKGNIIEFLTISNVGATLFVEVVNNGVIVKQEYLTLLNDGVQKIELDDKIKGIIFIRFKTIDNKSFVKILEIINRKYTIFSKNCLAVSFKE